MSKEANRRLLFQMASLPFLPFGINLQTEFRSKIIIPIQLFFFGSYLTNMVLLINRSAGSVVLMKFLLFYWIIGSVLTIIITFRQRRKILLLMDQLITNLPDYKIQSLSRRSVLYIIMCICLIFLPSLVIAVRSMTIDWNNLWDIALHVYWFLTMYFQGAVETLVMTFYLLQHDILYTHLSHVLRFLTKIVKKKQNLSLKQVYTLILHLHQRVDNFDDILSVYPFVGLSTLFFSGTSIVLSLRQGRPIERMAFPVIIYGFIFIVIWLIDLKKFKQQKVIENLMSLLVLHDSEDDSKLRQPILDSLKSLAKKKMTALRFFDLDRQMILSFCSAFVTFNALFISFT